MLRPPPGSPLFPYTTLFRSDVTYSCDPRAVVEDGRHMAKCIIRYWAAAKEAAGIAEESVDRSEEHTSELQSRGHLVCRLLLEKKNKKAMRKQSRSYEDTAGG